MVASFSSPGLMECWRIKRDGYEPTKGPNIREYILRAILPPFPRDSWKEITISCARCLMRESYPRKTFVYAKLQPSKLITRVRFPPPAPYIFFPKTTLFGNSFPLGGKELCKSIQFFSKSLHLRPHALSRDFPRDFDALCA